MRSTVKTAKSAKTLPPTRYRVVYDEDHQFEECNGEPRPLTEAEYRGNEYRGCPIHPRAGTRPDPTRPNTGQGICAACGGPIVDLPYDEYLAYYGNPDRHVYVGIIRSDRCVACGEYRDGGSLWGIDLMDDDPDLTFLTNGGDFYTLDELRGCLRECAAELDPPDDLAHASHATKTIGLDAARACLANLREIFIEADDDGREDWIDLHSCADAVEAVTLALTTHGLGPRP